MSAKIGYCGVVTPGPDLFLQRRVVGAAWRHERHRQLLLVTQRGDQVGSVVRSRSVFTHRWMRSNVQWWRVVGACGSRHKQVIWFYRTLDVAVRVYIPFLPLSVSLHLIGLLQETLVWGISPNFFPLSWNRYKLPNASIYFCIHSKRSVPWRRCRFVVTSMHYKAPYWYETLSGILFASCVVFRSSAARQDPSLDWSHWDLTSPQSGESCHLQQLGFADVCISWLCFDEADILRVYTQIHRLILREILRCN